VNENHDLLISFGGAIKTLGSGKIVGKAIVFSGPNDPDRVGDFFTKSTYFGKHAEVDLYWDHRRDDPLTTARLSMGTDALMATAQLDLSDATQRKLWNLAERGLLNFSSGSASHLVDRVPPSGRVGWLKRWPISELSLCPRESAAEPRAVVSVKSLGAVVSPGFLEELERRRLERIYEETIAEDMRQRLERLGMTHLWDTPRD
jgi:hypothetical protein